MMWCDTCDFLGDKTEKMSVVFVAIQLIIQLYILIIVLTPQSDSSNFPR